MRITWRGVGVVAVVVSALVGAWPPAPASATLAEQQNYVSRVYGDLLLREPDPVELATYAGALDAGTLTRGDFLSDILDAPELHDIWVYGVYLAYLDRGPTDPEYAARVAALSTSGDFLATEVAVLTSSSYFTAQGGDNLGFVHGIYEHVLWRTPNATDAAYWKGRLDTGTTRTYVATYFLRSNEAAQKRVKGTSLTSCAAVDLDADGAVRSGSYCLLLDRPADTPGYDYWWPRLAAADQLPSLWRSLAASAEYFAQAQL